MAVRVRSALLLLAAALIAGAEARHTNAKIRRDDRSLILVAQPFGFGGDGRMNLTVSNFQLWKTGSGPKTSKTSGYHRCAVPSVRLPLQRELPFAAWATCLLEL
jgi:hypothetical protein